MKVEKIVIEYIYGGIRLSSNEKKIINGIFILVFGLLTCLLFWVGISSLQWKFSHDSPILLYVVFLIDKFNYVPYRDIFDINLPGTYFIYYLIGHFSDYSDLGFRIADIVIVTGISTTTFFWLRPLGWKVAFCAPVSFGLLYFSWGHTFSLQRELIMILPISITLLLTVSLPKLNNAVRLISIGLIGGLCFLIKPHSILIYIAVVVYQLNKFRWEDKNFNRTAVIKTLLMYLTGFLGPNLIALIYLWKTGALPYLFGIASNYLPLYSHINGNLETIYGFERIKYVVKQYFRFASGFRSTIYWDNISLVNWFIPAGLGTFISFRYGSLSNQQKKLIYLVWIMAFISSLYPAFSGQFFFYHYYPFIYFIVILSSLCFFELSKAGLITRIIPMIIFLSLLLFKIYSLPQTMQLGREPLHNGLIDKIAYILKENVKEGETVQPLDFTFGAINAMLRAKVPIATPYIGDYLFYHDVSNPYIQDLRMRFIESLSISNPRFIVQVVDLNLKPCIIGPDTTTSFPELTNLINARYNKVVGNTTVVIYERKLE